jgi:putative sigma-54 modulation protein
MKSSVSFRHMKSSDAVRSHIEERLEKIERFVKGDAEARFTLALEKHTHVVHLELVVDGSVQLQAATRSDDMYNSVDTAVECVVRQLKRARSKDRNYREGSSPGRDLRSVRREEPTRAVSAANEDEGKLPRIVRQESMVPKEMNLDDAVMRMDLTESDFLVFTNAKNRLINVVYRLGNGEYGVIEASAA